MNERLSESRESIHIYIWEVKPAIEPPTRITTCLWHPSCRGKAIYDEARTIKSAWFDHQKIWVSCQVLKMPAYQCDTCKTMFSLTEDSDKLHYLIDELRGYGPTKQ